MLPSGQTTSGFPYSGNLRYPKEIQINKDTDYVEIKFYKYQPPFSAEAFESSNTQLSGYNSGGVSALVDAKNAPIIQLYMPEDMGAKYGANWGDKNISNQGRGLLGGLGDLMNTPNSGVAAFFGDTLAKGIGTTLTTTSQELGNFFTKGTGTIAAIQAALKATGFDPSLDYNDILGGVTGQILNPNTEVLYTGPQMRGFGLSFKMAPRNAPEATEIKKIIQTFKYAILPKFNGDSSQVRSFVGVPGIVDVTFKKGGSDHPYVTQYKPSALTGFDVSYTPDGAWATYADGSPVATTISLEFKELKMLYAEEITSQGGSF
jgi:hypothetical protein